MATPTQYVQTPTFYLSGAGSIQGAVKVSLTSFSDIYNNVLTMASFGTTGYGTLEPDTSNEEGFTFTSVVANANGTYTLGGVSTILAQSPYTQTSGLIRQHNGGQKVVITDNVAFWNTFANKLNDETVTGQWTFTNTPIVPGTVSVASTTVLGVSKTSVAPASAPNPIVVGTNDPRVPVQYEVDSGSANTYVITPVPAITAYAAGQMFSFQAVNANTGTSTLNVNGLGAKTIKKNSSVNLASGDIAANQVVEVIYDGTNMQMISNPLPYVPKYFTALEPSGSGTQTIAHGFGIVPKSVRLTSTYSSPNTAGYMSFGCYDGTNQNCVYIQQTASSVWASGSSNSYSISINSATAVVTFDSTNITLTWTGSTSSHFIVEATA